MRRRRRRPWPPIPPSPPRRRGRGRPPAPWRPPGRSAAPWRGRCPSLRRGSARPRPRSRSFPQDAWRTPVSSFAIAQSDCDCHRLGLTRPRAPASTDENVRGGAPGRNFMLELPSTERRPRMMEDRRAGAGVLRRLSSVVCCLAALAALVMDVTPALATKKDNALRVADDVVYTLNFVSKPENKATTQSNVDWIDHVEKLDPYRVRIVTRRPFPAAIEYLAGPIVIHPHAYYAQVGPQGMNQKPVGSGPYRVVEHAMGKYIRLVRNPDYFQDGPKPQPQIEKIELRFIPDRQTQVAEMLSGGLDLIKNVPLDQAQHLRGTPNLQVVSAEIMRYAFLQM